MKIKGIKDINNISDEILLRQLEEILNDIDYTKEIDIKDMSIELICYEVFL